MTLSLLRLLFTGSMYKKSPLEPEGPDEKLEEEVRRDFAFLFTKHQARIISNFYYPRSFGNAIIVIRVRDFWLQVVRDRGSICVLVGHTPPGPAEDPWTDISVAITSLDRKESNDEIPGLPSYATLANAAGLLEPALNRLEEAYSARNYEATAKKIKQINQASWKKLKEKTKQGSGPGKSSG